MKRTFVAILLILSAHFLHAQTNIAAKIEGLLPPAKSSVDVMGIVYPKRVMELTQKFQTAISTNKDWLLGYIKENAKEGEPLPYSPKFGLTQEEYTEYLSLAEKRTLEKTGSGVLVLRTNSCCVEFDGGQDLADLTGVKIDLKQLTVTTPFAELRNPTPKTNSGGPGLGAYSGFQWSFEESDSEKGNITEASFLIGKQKESGKYFIYYKGGIMKASNSISDVNICICYERE
jgi:hypothetical protein